MSTLRALNKENAARELFQQPQLPKQKGFVRRGRNPAKIIMFPIPLLCKEGQGEVESLSPEPYFEIDRVGLALMIATTLHAIATGNCLPAKVPTVCVDINPAVPTKLSDRGSFQAVGLVMDSSSFLQQLASELSWHG